MSVFLTPELKPFLGGTYFPPRDTFGRPGFSTVLKAVAKQVRTCAVGVKNKSVCTTFLLLIRVSYPQ